MLQLDDEFFDDFDHWLTTDPRTARRLWRIVREVLQDPFGGIGKPERMKHKYRGCWSRRITDEHRLVYRVYPDFIDLLTARSHYE
jgi:toxin YoeB